MRTQPLLSCLADLLSRLQPRRLAVVLCRGRLEKHCERVGLEEGRGHRQSAGGTNSNQRLSL